MAARRPARSGPTRRGCPAVRAVVPIWRRPWMVLGRDTFAGDVLARLGVRNVFAGPADRYPKLAKDDPADGRRRPRRLPRRALRVHPGRRPGGLAAGPAGVRQRPAPHLVRPVAGRGPRGADAGLRGELYCGRSDPTAGPGRPPLRLAHDVPPLGARSPPGVGGPRRGDARRPHPAGSGKVRRLRADPRVELRPCGRFGSVEDGVEPVSGTAEVRTADSDVLRARATIRRTYPIESRVVLGIERLASGCAAAPGPRGWRCTSPGLIRRPSAPARGARLRPCCSRTRWRWCTGPPSSCC